MKSPKSASAEDYMLMSSFEDMRKKLLAGNFDDRQDRDLSYWALPADRRLPYALLDRKVGELIRTPFLDLTSTPGIGRKKVASLLMLLNRVLQQGAPAQETTVSDSEKEDLRPEGAFDPLRVSEPLWEKWRETARLHGLEQETLGRLAPSLQRLPTVIWDSPLSTYLGHSVSEIRRLKTHGDKRVHAVLEVFCVVHETLGRAKPHRQLAIRLLPCFLAPLEHWINAVVQCRDTPNVQEIRHNLVLPLLNQIELDGGDMIHGLAAGRLGVEGPGERVREQAERRGLTRARIYQLLETCSEIMAVRWPEGRWQIAALATRLDDLSATDERRELIQETQGLIFPERRRSKRSGPALVESAS